jgi:hypothetical protein
VYTDANPEFSADAISTLAMMRLVRQCRLSTFDVLFLDEHAVLVLRQLELRYFCNKLERRLS